jgi:hypothetical protein
VTLAFGTRTFGRLASGAAGGGAAGATGTTEGVGDGAVARTGLERTLVTDGLGTLVLLASWVGRRVVRAVVVVDAGVLVEVGRGLGSRSAGALVASAATGSTAGALWPRGSSRSTISVGSVG